MKVLGFVGSPRKEANTFKLVSAVLEGAKSNNAETKIYNLNELNIKGCQSCYYCRTHEGCAVADDFKFLYSEILEADAVVIGSPVYMWDMTAQTKLLIDRFYPYLNPDYTSKIKGKKLILAFTQGNPNIDAFKAEFEHIKKTLEFLGFNVVDILVAANTRQTPVEKQNELLTKAFSLGKSM
jgi:multimeric flavodoxin WrbA